MFVLFAYWSIVAEDPFPTGGDSRAYDFANDIRAGWLDDLAEVVTFFGAGVFVIPLAALLGVWLGVKGRWTELVILAIGLLTTIVSVDLIKDATDRPRPPGGLVDTHGSAFPSAHAAYSTIYTWIAVTIAFRIDPDITRRALVITAGIVATALIGLTRVYLNVHWMSDVSAGWGLGASSFALVGAAALVIVHLRKNLRSDDRGPDSGRGAPAGARD